MKHPVWTRTANGANKRLALHVWLRCGSLSITTPVSLLANEFDVQSILHGKWAWQLSIKFMSFMRLWTVAKILWFIFKACFENVVVVFVFNVPPTAKVICRRGHGLKSHPTDWWSWESNLRPLVYQASGLSTTPQRLHWKCKYFVHE